MTREIKPEDVPAMMRDGRLEFGMELEFYDEVQWTPPREFTGFSTFNKYHFESVKAVYRSARFPLPNLRDGDPVFIRIANNQKYCRRHFYRFDENGNMNIWEDGRTRWGVPSMHHWVPVTDWRLPTKQELFEAGYTEDQIDEMMGRWGIKK